MNKTEQGQCGQINGLAHPASPEESCYTITLAVNQ
jgi:hypothetical protein